MTKDRLGLQEELYHLQIAHLFSLLQNLPNLSLDRTSPKSQVEQSQLYLKELWTAAQKSYDKLTMMVFEKQILETAKSRPNGIAMLNSRPSPKSLEDILDSI